MKKGRFKTTAVVVATAAFLCAALASGCTELERNGMSPIPQNSPGAWEINPYGEMIAN